MLRRHAGYAQRAGLALDERDVVHPVVERLITFEAARQPRRAQLAVDEDERLLDAAVERQQVGVQRFGADFAAFLVERDGADAAGGARALATSTDAVAADILAWLATIPASKQ
mgnify:CR=1 FL=1